VEYPTTRRLGATAVDRAAELHAAYADPDIRAVLATIGGDDEITVLPHLDPAPFVADPKPFLGYSEATWRSTRSSCSATRRSGRTPWRCSVSTSDILIHMDPAVR
jgi:LD-carboxypeptidase N-terminal domain